MQPSSAQLRSFETVDAQQARTARSKSSATSSRPSFSPPKKGSPKKSTLRVEEERLPRCVRREPGQALKRISCKKRAGRSQRNFVQRISKYLEGID